MWKVVKIAFGSLIMAGFLFSVSLVCFQHYAKHNASRYYDTKYIPIKHYNYIEADSAHDPNFYKFLTNKGKVITVSEDWFRTSVTHKKEFPSKKHPYGSTRMVLKQVKPKHKLPSYVRFMLGQPTNELIITKYKYDK